MLFMSESSHTRFAPVGSVFLVTVNGSAQVHCRLLLKMGNKILLKTEVWCSLELPEFRRGWMTAFDTTLSRVMLDEM